MFKIQEGGKILYNFMQFHAQFYDLPHGEYNVTVVVVVVVVRDPVIVQLCAHDDALLSPVCQSVFRQPSRVT